MTSYKICGNQRGATTIVMRFEPVESVGDTPQVGTSSPTPTPTRRKAPCQIRRDKQRIQQHNLDKSSYQEELSKTPHSSPVHPSNSILRVETPPCDSGLDQTGSNLLGHNTTMTTTTMSTQQHCKATSTPAVHAQCETRQKLELSTPALKINGATHYTVSADTTAVVNTVPDDKSTQTIELKLQDPEQRCKHFEHCGNASQTTHSSETHRSMGYVTGDTLQHLASSVDDYNSIINFGKFAHHIMAYGKSQLTQFCSTGKDTTIQHIVTDPSNNDIIRADTAGSVEGYALHPWCLFGICTLHLYTSSVCTCGN